MDKINNDYDFIKAIRKDIDKNGFVKGGMADQMLKDWQEELRKKNAQSIIRKQLKKNISKSMRFFRAIPTQYT